MYGHAGPFEPDRVFICIAPHSGQVTCSKCLPILPTVLNEQVETLFGQLLCSQTVMRTCCK